MMRRTKIGLIIAMAVGLALGVFVGPALRGAVASAQTTTPPTQSQGVGATLKNLFLDQLAAALNIQRSALDSAIVSAGTRTADTAVQQGTLTQAQADALKARVQAGDLGALLGDHAKAGGRGELGGVKQAMLNAAAKALNVTAAELQTQLRGGQTLAQIAQAHGTTEQAVVAAALAAAKTQLDQNVVSGGLTRAQADAIYAQLQQQGTNLFTSHGPGRGGRNRSGGPTTPQAPTATPRTT